MKRETIWLHGIARAVHSLSVGQVAALSDHGVTLIWVWEVRVLLERGRGTQLLSPQEEEDNQSESERVRRWRAVWGGRWGWGCRCGRFQSWLGLPITVALGLQMRSSSGSLSFPARDWQAAGAPRGFGQDPRTLLWADDWVWSPGRGFSGLLRVFCHPGCKDDRGPERLSRLGPGMSQR